MGFSRLTASIVFLGLLCPGLVLAQAGVPAEVSGTYDVTLSHGGRETTEALTIAQEGRSIVVERFLDKKDLGSGSYDPDNGFLLINVGDDQGEMKITVQCDFEGLVVVCEGQASFQSLVKRGDQVVLAAVMRAQATSPGKSGAGLYQPMSSPGRPLTDHVTERYKKTD